MSEFSILCLGLHPFLIRILRNIYLLTKHAWYKLDSPAASYRKHFREFARQHRILQTLLTEAQKEVRLTPEGFKALLDEMEDDGDAPQVSSEDLDDPVVVRTDFLWANYVLSDDF